MFLKYNREQQTTRTIELNGPKRKEERCESEKCRSMWLWSGGRTKQRKSRNKCGTDLSEHTDEGNSKKVNQKYNKDARRIAQAKMP